MSDPKPEKRHCGAKTRAGTPCQRAPVAGRTRCRLHGGLTLRGPEHPRFKNGTRVVKFLPEGLQGLAERTLADPDILNLSERLAILEAMLAQSVQAWDAGGGGAIWEKLQKTWNEYNRERAKGKAANVGLMAQLVAEAQDLCRRGYADYFARSETREIIQDIRKVTESERKRRIDMQAMVSLEELVLLMTKLGESVSRHVADTEARQAIYGDLLGLLAGYQQRTDHVIDRAALATGDDAG